MEDDITIRILVEALSAYYIESKNIEVDLTHLLSKEFLWNFLDVFIAKQSVLTELQIFSSDFYETMLSSSEIYLRYLIYACQMVTRVIPEIFERFISTLAILLHIIAEIQVIYEVNFCKLAPDIFMVFYEKELKKKFRSNGGFRRFVEYINNPDYLKLNGIEGNISSCDSFEAVDKISADLRAFRIHEEQKRLQSINWMDAEMDLFSLDLAKKVLTMTKTELPLPSDDDLMADSMDKLIEKHSQSESGRALLKMAEEVRDYEETLEYRLSLESDCVANDDSVEQMANNASYEKIIEAVVKHNHSKTTSHGMSKGRIQTQLGGILNHLKSTIKSVIEVLDE